MPYRKKVGQSPKMGSSKNKGRIALNVNVSLYNLGFSEACK